MQLQMRKHANEKIDAIEESQNKMRLNEHAYRKHQRKRNRFDLGGEGTGYRGY
jgi:hypothetical protein